MEFVNTFFVPLSPAEAFKTLTDLEGIAPCMPGAVLHDQEGDQYRGEVRVKVGPMTLTYQGTAEMGHVDEEGLSAVIQARGREKRGSGRAAATVHARLVETDGGTDVTVTTDLDVTGKPAQFGRGVMADIGSRLIETFADNLARSLAADVSGDDVLDRPAPHPAADNVLNLGSIGGRTLARRTLPWLVPAGAFLVWWLLRRALKRQSLPHQAR